MKPWMIWLLGPILLAIVVWAVHAEESVPLPQITIEQQRDYHRLRAELLATPQQRALDDKISELQATCGDRPVLIDNSRNPQCGAKAQPAAKGN